MIHKLIKITWFILLGFFILIDVLVITHILFEIIPSQKNLAGVGAVLFAAIPLFYTWLTYRDFVGRPLKIYVWLIGYIPLFLLIIAASFSQAFFATVFLLPLFFIAYVKFKSLKEPLPESQKASLRKIIGWPSSWKSDIHFPVRFIAFFALITLFLGEYINMFFGILKNGGYHNLSRNTIIDGSNIIILPLVYTIAAAIFWLLYRKMNWLIVAVVAGSLLAIGEYFFITPDPSSAASNLPPLAAIPLDIIAGAILVTLPYALFTALRRYFGEKGINIVIYFLISIHIISIATFAYFKYVF